MNSDCQKFQPLLPDHRWMNPGERQALDRHLAKCAECRAELREMQIVGEWFAQARATAPGGFADGVMAGIMSEPAKAGKGWLAAAAVLLGALGVEVALATTLRVGPGPWWRAMVAAGDEFLRQWCLPVLAGWRELVAPLFDGWPQVHAAWWGGAALVVVVFSWFTINRGRQENA